MSIHTKIFFYENNELDNKINEYIDNYRIENMCNLIPINTCVIKNHERINYFMIPDRVEILVTFEEKELTEKEIIKIKNRLETEKRFHDSQLGFNIRKNKVNDELMFWFIDNYYNIYDIFGIRINKDTSEVFVYRKLYDNILPSIFLVNFKNDYEWSRFTYDVENKLKKVLFE